jgi:hypothetical protein
MFYFAIIGILFLVIGGIAMLYRSSRIHQEACAPEHIAEVVEIIKKLKEELITKINSESSFEIQSLRELEQKHRVVIRYTTKKLVLTYLTSAPTDDRIIHSFSMSWTKKKLPIKTAAYLSSVIVHTLQLQEKWDKDLRVSIKKAQVFHFLIKLKPEENKHYLSTTTTTFEKIQEQKEAIRDLSLDIKVQRKTDQSSAS